MKKTLLGLVAAVLLAGPALSHAFSVGDLKVHHPYIPQPLTRAMSAAGYLSIENKGAEADRLIGVESPAAASLQIHTTEHGTDGTAKMIHVETVDIPAGETVVLERGGYHIMIMGLVKALAVGDKIPAVLVFEKAGRVEVVFNVETPKIGEAASEHSGH